MLSKVENHKEYVLLQGRQNTGVLDGMYDVAASGHLEAGETLKEAMIRETKEEIGIDVKAEDLSLVSTMSVHLLDDNEYIFACFHAKKYEGIPTVMEKDKCSDLKWFPIDELPANIVDSRVFMIEDYQNGNTYREYGYQLRKS